MLGGTLCGVVTSNNLKPAVAFTDYAYVLFLRRKNTIFPALHASFKLRWFYVKSQVVTLCVICSSLEPHIIYEACLPSPQHQKISFISNYMHPSRTNKNRLHTESPITKVKINFQGSFTAGQQKVKKLLQQKGHLQHSCVEQLTC